MDETDIPRKKKHPSASSQQSTQKQYPSSPPSYQQQQQQYQSYYQQQQQQQQPYQSYQQHSSRNNNNNNNKTSHSTYILVQWKQQLKPFYLNPEQYHQYTIHDIKLQCKAVFHIPIANMTIQYNGGYLKDDQATLISLSIHPGSTLLVHGENVNAEQLQQIASGNEEEVGYLTRIQKIMENTRPLEIRVKALEDIQEQQQEKQSSLLNTHHTNSASSSSQDINDEKKEDLSLYEEQQSEVMYISEMLVRSLLTLDGVECPSSFATARQERRAAVHFCQNLLDRVDKLKSLYIQQQQQQQQQQKL
ncbi:unnamed protein product [Cunninghamella blakesleeana]